MKSRVIKGSKHRSCYVRYADDWIMISNGGKPRMEEWKSEISNWMQQTLRLKLSEEKTKITDMRKEPAKFKTLGLIYSTLGESREP